MLSNLNGQLAAPMFVDDRIVFLSDHEGTGNLYSATLGGGDLRRHTDHDGFYARNPATDGSSIVYHVGRATSGASTAWPPTARPRKLDIQLHRAARAARVPRVISAAETTSASSTATSPARPAWSRCAAPCTG